MSTAFRMIFPPSHLCMNKSCERFQRLMLKKSEARRAVLFTINNGPIPVWNLHLYCERMQSYLILYFFWMLADLDILLFKFYQAARLTTTTIFVSMRVDVFITMKFLIYYRLASINLPNRSSSICGFWWCCFLGLQPRTAHGFTTWVLLASSCQTGNSVCR